MNQEIAELRVKIAELQSQLHGKIVKCIHKIVPNKPYDIGDKWFSTGVHCENCNIIQPGWYCHTSPEKTCDYLQDGTFNPDDCIYCHLPDERK